MGFLNDLVVQSLSEGKINKSAIILVASMINSRAFDLARMADCLENRNLDQKVVSHFPVHAVYFAHFGDRDGERRGKLESETLMVTYLMVAVNGIAGRYCSEKEEAFLCVEAEVRMEVSGEARRYSGGHWGVSSYSACLPDKLRVVSLQRRLFPQSLQKHYIAGGRRAHLRWNRECPVEYLLSK